MSSRSYLCWLPGRYVGGAERYAINFSSKLAHNGFSVTILCPYYECYRQVKQILNTICITTTPSLTILYCKAPSTSRLWKLPVIKDVYLSIWSRKYLKLLLEMRPSAIHIVLPFPPRSFSFILAATNSLIPVTITFQLVPSPARLPKRYFKLFRSLLPRVTLCTVSRSNQLSIAHALDVPAETIHYIPNRPLPCSGNLSAEEKNSLLTELNLDSGHFICTTVAALEPRKGHEDIINACNILKTADCPIRFLFIGTGHHQSYLKSLVTSLGLDNYILFAGSRSDVDSILQISNAFIFPSSAEGLSFALMEAVQRNVPLIASNRCGADDFLNPLVHFKDYEYGNSSQLAHHILLTHNFYQNSLNSAQLASSVLSEYDFDAMCQSTVEILFRNVLANHNLQRPCL